MFDKMKGLLLYLRLKAVSAFILVAMVFSSAGCSTIHEWYANPANKVAIKTVVTIAVMDLVTKHPEYREKIRSTTTAVRLYVDGKPLATAPEIMALVSSKIEWDKLKPEESLAIQIVMSTIQASIEEKLASGQIKQDYRVSVGQMLDWVAAAAEY